MIQVFDTHCMGYRNAKLRAFALADNTRRLDFYNFANINISDADNCGNEIETDEAGYLFYGGGQHRILCLGLQEAAIIEVSLDDGTTWQIQWIIHEPTGNGSPTEPATLSWRNANGVIETYSPNGNNKALPEFLLKRDYQSGKWAEEEVILAANDAALRVAPWTKTLLISQAAPGTITLTERPRYGQVIIINACRQTHLVFNDGINAERPIGGIENGHTYLLLTFATTGGYNNGYPMLIDVTVRTAELPDRAGKTITPTWAQIATYEWESSDIYSVADNEALTVNFDYRELPGTGWSTGHTNILRIKLYKSGTLKMPMPIILKPVVAMPAAASTYFRIRIEIRDDATDNVICTLSSYSNTYTTAASTPTFYTIYYVGDDTWLIQTNAYTYLSSTI